MENRDDWNAPVAEMVASFNSRHCSKQHARSTLGFFAKLLRADMLPESGRQFLADKIEAIANGRSPGTLLPRQRTQRRNTPLSIMVAVERQRAKVGASHGDMTEAVYKPIAKRREITPGFCAKRASEGRRQIRQTLEREVAAGTDAHKVIEALARTVKLPAATVQKITSKNRLER